MWLLQLVAFAFGCLCVSAQVPVKVAVYYESRCSDSVYFVASQLKPTFDSLGPTRMTVDFVPYGKATHTARGAGFAFNNQHGHREYLGNKLHACVIDALAGNQVATVNFVTCGLNSPDVAANLDGICFTGIPLASKMKIRQCNEGVEGDRLLARHGDRTHALVPKMSLYPNMGHVPRVEINGIYNVNEEQMANNNLKSLICSKLIGSQLQCISPTSQNAPQQLRYAAPDYAQIPSYPAQSPSPYYPTYPTYPAVTGYHHHYPGYPTYNQYPVYNTPNTYPGYSHTPNGYIPAPYPGAYPTQSPYYPYGAGYPGYPGQPGYPSPQPQPQPQPTSQPLP